MYGGKVELHGLVKAEHLNGEHGVCFSYNADGKRRLGVRLSKSKKTLALHAHNFAPLDDVHCSADQDVIRKILLAASGCPCSRGCWYRWCPRSLRRHRERRTVRCQ